MLSDLPYLPLENILKRLPFESIVTLLKVPTMRETVIEFYSDPYEYNRLEMQVKLDCITELEKDLDTHFFSELMDWLEETQGYQDFRTTPLYLQLKNEFIEKVTSFVPDIEYEFTTHMLDEIVDVIQEDLTEEQMNQVKELFEKYSEIIDQEEELYENRFKADQYNNPIWVESYLQEIKKYLQQYYPSKDKRIKNFYQCLSKKLGFMKLVFG
jgi:hypothetical protein